jgi:beta-glucanase (GH16 family)
MNKKQAVTLVVVAFMAIFLAAPGAPALGAGRILADFAGGTPDGWFVFNGGSTVVTTTQVVPETDPLARPGQLGDNEILATDFNIFDYGGFGRAYDAPPAPQDWSSFVSFQFWFYGSGSGLSYQAEISDNRSDPNSDTSERFDYTFSDDTAGWRFISIPFADFSRATDFQPGGAPDDGFTLTEIWAWAIVLPQGTDSVYFDDFSLGQRVVDDFESGLPSGTDADGVSIGFFTFQGAGSSVAIATTGTPPEPVPPAAGFANQVLQVDVDVTSYAGLIHGFENPSLDTWVAQDWSGYGSFTFWLYGTGSGTDLFVDLLENRKPGSTTDDAERWTVTFSDDFTGWRQLEFPFDSFVRKDVGNGAPNDGLALEEVHGWAFGTLGTGGPRTYYLDDVALAGRAELPELAVTFSAAEYVVAEGTAATVTVRLSRELGEGSDDPAQVSVAYSSEPGTALAGRDYSPVAGTLTFIQGDPSEQAFAVPTLDNAKHDGDKTVILRLVDPVGAPLGFVTQAVVAILDDEPLDTALLDDFERGAYLWYQDGVALATPEIAAGDPLALPGQGDYEHILEVSTDIQVNIVIAGTVCNSGSGVVPVAILTTDQFDARTVNHNTVRLGEAAETHRVKKTGEAQRHEEDFDGDGDIDLVFHFRADETGYDCDSTAFTLVGETFSGEAIIAGGYASFGREFPIGQDWTRAEGLSFWFYGTNSGDAVTLQVKENRAPDPGPDGWSLVWSDEFDEAAGTPPDPTKWGYEVGDGAANRIPGWGNSELQYYTTSAENAATDGQGHLRITAAEADGSLLCYYGPCQYSSARLVSQHRAEFAYGRIESRILVPQGAGLWPAFWSLGTDIAEVGWPQTGEIDFMEFVGRLPYEIFGTIHGPGYSGGQSFGNIYQFDEPVYESFHTFAVEWEPDVIRWYVDGILYHTATPADVAPNQWVFNDPVYLLLNVAVGGNFGGPVGAETTFPQEMVVDYVRVYQGPDTAERWQASFLDNFEGWQQVVIPFAALTRSDSQPAGAPDDGLSLEEVWGYGFVLPGGGTSSGALRLDQVRLELIPPPTELTVTNLNDSGPGSLRQALADIAIGGTITFEPALAGGTVALTSGPLVPRGDVTIDAAAAPGLTLDGGGSDRLLIVDAGLTVTAAHLTIANGYGFQLAGGILNNGNLTLDHVTVTGNTMTTDAGDFWQGGGGIYNGSGATLKLVDSTVSNNHAGWSGGGIYSFFGSSTTIVRSTIAGNVSNDVGGGLRLLGNATITNSTISGNEATGWYGGALFVTDGVVSLTYVTVAGNISPDWAPADVFVGTFTDASATLNVASSIIASARDNCFLAPFGAGAVALNSLGHNVLTDDTCYPVGSDQLVDSAGIGPLADNGGPTATQALLPGSPAIDAVDNALCPETDQRGVARPQGAACDAGAFELAP